MEVRCPVVSMIPQGPLRSYVNISQDFAPRISSYSYWLRNATSDFEVLLILN